MIRCAVIADSDRPDLKSIASIVIRNDLTGDQIVGNYDVQVYIQGGDDGRSTSLNWTGRLESFDRRDGAVLLIRDALCAVYGVPTSIPPQVASSS